MLAFLPALVLASVPPTAIPVDGGFLMPTGNRTIARFQLAIGDVADYELLRRVAESNAARRKPRPLRVLQVIARRISAPIKDKDGKPVHAASTMSNAEVRYCREVFKQYQSLVFVYTGGALKVQPDELVIEEAIPTVDDMGNNAYWLSAWTALKGRESLVKKDYYDSITVYYKKPENMRAGLLGGAIGRDYGVQGSSFWTQWINRWDDPIRPLNGNAIVSLHEWLHNTTFTAHQIMGYTAYPDCHAAEEWGYQSQDGGYRQWQAWNRDLMLRIAPREMWYGYDTKSRQRTKDDPPIGQGATVGKLYTWKAVASNWMAKLPLLSDSDLARLTGLEDLKIEVGQPAANSHVVWRAATSQPIGSPAFGGELKSATTRLDNVVSLARRATDSDPEDAFGGYQDSEIESMLIVRNPKAPSDRRDLVLVRADVAPQVLRLLTTKGRAGLDSIVGYVCRPDPSEKQPVSFVAALVNLGDQLPADELAAIGH